MLHPPLRRTSKRALATAALLASLPLLGGCATQQTLQEYEDTIVRLREEKTQLQRENQSLRGELSRYEAELARANVDIESLRNQPAPSMPTFDNPNITTEFRDGLLAIQIPSSITFPSGSADLSASGKSAIQSVANVLRQDYGSAMYWIEGHTDTDQPSKSKFKSNRELSVARAMSVLQHMVTQCGIADEKCVIAGHGEYTPVAPGASKSQNRRVEIVVHPQG